MQNHCHIFVGFFLGIILNNFNNITPSLSTTSFPQQNMSTLCYEKNQISDLVKIIEN